MTSIWLATDIEAQVDLAEATAAKWERLAWNASIRGDHADADRYVRYADAYHRIARDLKEPSR